MTSTFKALVLHENAGKVEPRIETVEESALPEGEVLVAVEYSTLNYKDGLILNGLGRPALHDYLKDLGATTLVERAALAAEPKRPLDSERWAGAIDAVGGTTLATVLTQLKYGAAVAACGLAGGNALPTTVIPFLLRGVNLLGIDSVMCPVAPRREAWARLVRDLPAEKLDAMTETVPLAALPELADRILKGEVRGRIVVDVNA